MNSMKYLHFDNRCTVCKTMFLNLNNSVIYQMRDGMTGVVSSGRLCRSCYAAISDKVKQIQFQKEAQRLAYAKECENDRA